MATLCHSLVQKQFLNDHTQSPYPKLTSGSLVTLTLNAYFCYLLLKTSHCIGKTLWSCNTISCLHGPTKEFPNYLGSILWNKPTRASAGHPSSIHLDRVTLMMSHSPHPRCTTSPVPEPCSIVVWDDRTRLQIPSCASRSHIDLGVTFTCLCGCSCDIAHPNLECHRFMIQSNENLGHLLK